MKSERNPGSDIVFVVHGSNAHTWWRRLANGGYAWWRSWSLFGYSLRQAFDHDCQILEYRWSGDNTNAARIEAGTNLAAAIDQQNPDRRIHIVGHSHGGNVALIAANHLPAGRISTIVLLANPHMALLKKDGSSSWLYWGRAVERVDCIWNLYSPGDKVQSVAARLLHGIPSARRSLLTVSRTYEGPESQKVRNAAVQWKGLFAAHRAMHSSPLGTVVGKLLQRESFADALSAAHLVSESRNSVPDRGGFAGVEKAQEMIRLFADHRPFDLPAGSDDNGVGLLLIHGFTASPSEMRPLADYIWKRTAWRCKAILLPGHGTRVEHLQRTNAQGWVDAVEKAYLEMATQCREVFLIGLSLGATLCCHVALHKLQDSRLRGLILLAPAFGVSRKRTLGIRALAPFRHRRSKGPRAVHYFLDRQLFSYVETPLDRAADVISLGRQALQNLDRLKEIPTLMLSGELDTTVSLDVIHAAAKQNPWIRFVSLPKSRHILTVEPESTIVFDTCISFIDENLLSSSTTENSHATRSGARKWWSIVTKLGVNPDRQPSFQEGTLMFVLSGLLLYAAVPPIGLGFPAFFALVPLIHAATRSSSYRSAAFGGFLTGAIFFLPALYWLTPVTVLGWIALSLYCATYPAVFTVFARMFGGRVFPLAAAWVLLEFFRGAIAFTGFPWLLLSHTQADLTFFSQILDIVGSYGLSGILVGLNVLLYKGITQSRRHAWVAASIFMAISVYGYVRILTLKPETLLRVAMVQASVPQEMKEVLAGHYDPAGVLERYLEASKSIPKDPKVDLVVWPETVVLSPYILNVNPDVLKEDLSRTARFAQDSLANLGRTHNAYVLAGATSYLPAVHRYVSDATIAAQIPSSNWRKRYNSAYLLDSSGRYLDRYDKTHLVPFGEYIPLPNVFPFLAKLVPFDASLSSGEEQTIFEIPHNGRTVRFGVLICYEDTDSELARRLRRDGANFIINISNDAWFGLSELDQHFVAARFRAIENRVGIVRSGNNGITGVIDPMGRVGPVLQKNAKGSMVDEVQTTSNTTIYTRFGDWPAVASSGLLLLYPLLRRRQWVSLK